ncbi:DoxX family protein [Nocardioides insulae]|uniref:DoxX family protein n=1 Tax=Nocardioides insulae TaxID=394734 RepID=UPI0003F5978D|nr:DoxX family protein [Nocardioides insulae]
MTTLSATSATSAAPVTRTTPGRAARSTGWVLTGLVTLFLAFDSITHLLRVPQVVEANEAMGGADWFPTVCGVVLALCLIAYHVPATRAMGAVLLTAYLGGACAANLLTQAPLANTGFAIATAVLVWAGAWPREPRLRALVGG